MPPKTLSHVQGKGSISHNNREFTYGNVDPARTKDNIVYIKQPLQEAYNQCFGGAMERYNAKQTRSDRKIDDYYSYLFGNAGKNSVATGANKQKSFYETVVGIGIKDDAGVGTPDGELATDCLDEYMLGFAKRNPNFHVFNAVLHMDESTPHLHIDYIPIGHYNRGMDTQNGLAQALKEMGYDSGKDAINRWRLAERKVLEEICRERGIEIAEPQKGRGKTLAVDDYKAQRDEQKSLAAKHQQNIKELKNTNQAEVNREKKAQQQRLKTFAKGKQTRQKVAEIEESIKTLLGRESLSPDKMKQLLVLARACEDFRAEFDNAGDLRA